jgi:predicted transcriptional regulator of viral defense system
MQHPGRTVERESARIAGGAHGVVTRAQLLNAGVTPQEIRSRVESGYLLREHRGVYRVGHRAPTTEATYLAAVLAAGEGALLSGLAAAHLHGLVKGPPPQRT